MKPGDVATLLQLADSALPVGGFAHSDGVESVTELLDAPGATSRIIVAHALTSVAAGDGPIVTRAHRATRRGRLDHLVEVARSDLAARSARLQRNATLTVGGSLLRVAEAIASEAETGQLAVVRERLQGTTPRPSVFGAVAAIFGTGEESATHAYLYHAVAGLVNAAVRMHQLTPMDAQRVLREVMVAGTANGGSPIEGDEWGFASPLLDVATMWQETRAYRVFAS